MGFERVKGVTGLVYVPEDRGQKKHACKDCYCCRWCSDEKCMKCLKANQKQDRSGAG